MIIDGSGRFVLHDKPAAFPFSDIVTGTSEGAVFDLSVDLEYYSGVAYVKAEHVKEMAKTLGMLTKEEADELRATFAKQELPAYVESFINGINASVLSLSDARALVPISAPVYLLDSYKESEGSTGTESVQSEGTDSESGKGEAELDGHSPENSERVEAGESPKPSGKDSKPSLNKGPAKLPAGSNDGFDF